MMERTTFFPNSRDDLIREFCSEARTQLEQVQDKEEAVKLSRDICTRLAGKCSSTLVLSATFKYMQRLLRERWKAELPAELHTFLEKTE